MRSKTNKTDPLDATTTRVDIGSDGSRISIVGPALAVIALVAVIGMIWLSGKLVDLSGKAIEHPEIPRSAILPHDTPTG